MIYLAAVAALLIAAVAVSSGVVWHGRLFPGVLVDPDRAVSSIGLPYWQGMARGLRFPDRVVSVDGRPLVAHEGELAARPWDRELAAALAQGRTSVRVAVEGPSGSKEVSLELQPFDGAAWWLFGGGLHVIGLFYVGGAIVAVRARPHGRLARTFAKFSVLVAVFLFTLLDYHTDRRLVSFFLIAFAMLPMAALSLPLRLPSDAGLIRRHPWIEPALDFAGLSLGLAMVVMTALGASTLRIRSVPSMLFGLSLLLLAIGFLVRMWRSTGDDREVMKKLFVATVPISVALGLAFLLAIFELSTATLLWCSMPAVAMLPLSALFAFVRHDLWGSRAVLSRTEARVAITLGVCILGTAGGAAIAARAGIPMATGLATSAAAATVTAGAVLAALGIGDRQLFPSRASYKPTIEQLSDELTSIASRSEVAAAVERTVRRWLPCERIEFAVSDGQAVDSERGSEDLLTVPVRFRSTELGCLRVGRKVGGALFTTEDVDLLRTIANQAALALAHASSYAELEEQRLQQARAWKGEREVLVETMAAEIAHEVRYPINFFRSIFQRGSHGEKLDAEEIDIGSEEVDRLERLVSGLRKVSLRQIQRRETTVADLVIRCEVLLRDRLKQAKLHRHLDQEGLTVLRCDPDQITQVLVNLLSNAFDAAGSSEGVGVEWREEGGATLTVWDRGPGFDGDPSRVFLPWFSTKPRGTGLGLAIAHRIVRSHGWTIDARREEGTTRFEVAIPSTDLRTSHLASAEHAGETHEDSDRG